MVILVENMALVPSTMKLSRRCFIFHSWASEVRIRSLSIPLE